MDNLTVFIPTRNRPLQLEACLVTLNDALGFDIPNIVILERNDKEYKENYTDAINSIELPIYSIPEKDFRKDLIAILSQIPSKYILCLTDDTVFWRDNIHWQEILKYMDKHPEVLTYSFRLGENCKIQDPLTGSLSLSFSNNLETREFINHHFFGKFNCTDKLTDSNLFYQISMDGHIYRREELLKMCQSVPFSNLREWEGNLIGATRSKDFIYKDKPYIACDVISATVNLIINQQLPPFSNNVSPVYRSAEELNKIYSEGKRIQIKKTLNGVPEGSHVFRQLYLV